MSGLDHVAKMIRDYVGDGTPASGDILRGYAGLYAATGKKQFRDYALERFAAIPAEDAGDKGLPDYAAALFFALDETGDERYRDAIERFAVRARSVCENARASAEEICVALPFYAAYEMRFDGKREIGNVVSAFRRLRDSLYDEERGLYAASPEEKKRARFSLLPETRILAALIDCVEIVDEQLYEHRRGICDLFREAVPGLLPRLDGESNLFNGILEPADAPDNAPDFVGTALAAYAVMKGVRLGVLNSEKVMPYGTRAFLGVHMSAFRKKRDEAGPGALAGPFMLALGEYHRTGKEM